VVTTGEVVMDHTEIVNADVCELRAACHFAERPHTGCRRVVGLF
jgi:hypothetical protein